MLFSCNSLFDLTGQITVLSEPSPSAQPSGGKCMRSPRTLGKRCCPHIESQTLHDI